MKKLLNYSGPDHRNEGFTARDAHYEQVREHNQTNHKTSITKQGLRQYTQKELEKKGGPVYSYNFNEPMLWHEFKEMSVQNRKDYIQYLRDKYPGVRITDLSNMMGIGNAALGIMLHDLGFTFPRGGRETEGQRRFREEMLPKPEPEVVEEPAIEEQPAPSFTINRVEFTCDAKDIAKMMELLPVAGSVKVIVEEVM